MPAALGPAAEFGHPPQASRPTSGKAMKRYLTDYLEQAGKVVMEGGTEFADEIVRAMDLFPGGEERADAEAIRR